MIAPNKEEPPLETNELQFAMEVARGASIAKAAAAAGISEATGYRWAKRPEVTRYVEEVRASVLQAAASRICDLTTKAVETLSTLLESSDARIQLAAARQILEGAVKLRELADLENELADLRTQLVELERQHNLRREY